MKRALLASAATSLILLWHVPAWAQSPWVGEQGISFPQGTGGDGGTGGPGPGGGGEGGGGGGAGTVGGFGGGASVYGYRFPQPGGGGQGGSAAALVGQTLTGGEGGEGTEGSNGGSGGGGGGGAHGYVGNSAPTSVALGGDGGDGANGTYGSYYLEDGRVYFAGGGGSGGNGGYGASLSPQGGTIVISLPVSGGEGGAGGSGFRGAQISGWGADGGQGGTGLYFAADHSTLLVNGDIEGGMGGTAGTGQEDGEAGDGGTGLIVMGLDNTIIITANGTVTGGLNGDLTDQAPAIEINGGGITLVLETGYAINGDVKAVSGADNTLALGGSAPGSFDVSQIGDSFDGFDTYAVSGGTWALTNTNTSALNWLVEQGTMSIVQAGSLGGQGSSLTLGSSGTLQTTATMSIAVPVNITGSSVAPASINALTGTTLTLSGTITGQSPSYGSGPSGLIFGGGGTVVLTGSNNFYGATVAVADGTLELGNASALNNVAQLVVDAGASVTLDTDVTLAAISGGGTIDVGSNTLTIPSNVQASAFGGTVTGAGTLTLDSPLGFTFAAGALDVGQLDVEDGLVKIKKGVSVSSGLQVTLAEPAALTLGQDTTIAGITGQGTVNLGKNRLTVSNTTAATFSGDLSGDGGLTKSGSGTFTLNGANTYTGRTEVDAGTLVLDGGQAISDNGAVKVLAAGTLQLDASETIGSLDGAGTVVLGGNALILGGNGRDTTFSGTISGGALAMNGTGRLTLTGTADLSGGLTIASGTVRVGNGTTSSTLQGNVQNNGILTLRPAGAMTLQGVVSGTGTLIVDTGTVTLTADNSFTGTTLIRSGSLQLGNGGATGSIGGNVEIESGSLVFNASATSTFAGLLSGAGAVAFQAGGTTTLTAANTYSGGTLITDGASVVVSADSNLGAATGALTFEAGTLATSASFTSTRALALEGAAAIATAAGTTLTLNGAIGGSGAASTLTASGTGTLVLGGTNSYTGGTVVSGGTLSVSSDTNLGATVGGLTLSGGTLAASSSFSSARSVVIGSSGGTLAVASGQSLTLAGPISGSGNLTTTGPGTVILTGTGSIGGATTVASGTLALYGAALETGSLTVSSGGTLTGYGTVNGAVSVLAGGTLAGGVGSTDNPTRTGLVTGDLTLAAGSNAILTLGGHANSGVAAAQGDLSAAGSLSVTGAPVHGAGYYRAFAYTGTLTNALSIAAVPAGYTATLDTSNTGQVNVLLTDAGRLQIWTADGGQNLGGAGTWSSTSTTWYEPAEGVTMPWGGKVGIFTGTAGTVLVSHKQTFEKLEFVSSGFVLAADASHADSGLAFEHGGVLWAEGHDVTATISAGISGSGGLEKIGAGTLVLTGVNSYMGGTTVSGGVLEVGADSALGAADGGITLSEGALSAFASFTTARAVTLETRGTLAADSGTTLTVTGTISGSGTLRKEGTGTVVLSGANTYSGDTVIAAGTLSVTGGSAISDASDVTIDTAGTLALGASETIASLSGAGRVQLGANTLTVSGTSATVFRGRISGTGGLVVSGGILALGGGNTYAGGTTITAGTLIVGEGGTHGAIAGNVTNNGSLIFYRSDTVTFGGAISGSGAVVQAGGGTLVLTGTNTYAGGTLVSGGTLQVSSDANLGAASGGVVLEAGTLAATDSFTSARVISLVNGGMVSVAGSAQLTLSGAVGGTGGLTKSGGGTLVLASNTSYAGGTVIAAGTLQVGTGGTSGAITGDVQNSGVLAFDLSSNTLFTGDITGSGSLVQAGSGGLVLTGNNQLAGGVVIESGTLQIGNGGTSGTLAGAVQNNSALIFSRSDATTFDGAISGRGAVYQSGGTLTLTGTSSYTGGTTIGAGATVSVSQDANLGSDIGALILAGGTLDVSASFSSSRVVRLAGGGTLSVASGESLSLSGVVQGNGGLNLAGLGTVVLTANNAYTGNTVIGAGGTLQLGNGGTTGSIVGNVVDGGLLRFDRANTVTFAGAISGTGQVVQAGTGTLVLAGTNTYTGGTLITSGRVQVGDGGTSGSIAGNVWNDGTLVFRQSDAITFGGVISGAGKVVQLGAGNLTLTGHNTYAGGTLIGGGGTLSVAKDGYLGGLASNITLMGGTLRATAGFSSARDVSLAGNGTIRVVRGATLDLSGTVSGKGTLVKTGSGTLLLTAANTYTKDTQINGGTLAVVADSGLGAKAGTIFINGAALAAQASFATSRSVILNGGGLFNVSENERLALKGTVSGTGPLRKNGTGTLVLSGVNSYTGGVVIGAGTVIGNAASILGNVHNNGVLTFNQVGLGTYAGGVDGTGQFVKTGKGKLVLTGAVRNTGGTVIQEGVLQVGDGGTSGALSGPITNWGTLIYDLASTYVFPQRLTGSGAVILEGGGTAHFVSSTYAGTVTLAGSDLIFSRRATSAASFVVGNDSVLSGIAAIGGLTVGWGGTVSPGYSPGTLKVNGNATFENGSTYRADVVPTSAHDLIVASGEIAIKKGSTLAVVAGRGKYPGSSSFTILRAGGGITGAFSTVTSNFAFLDPLLSYGTNAVKMTLVRKDVPFVSEARTANERSVARATDALGPGNEVYDAVVSQRENEAHLAFRALSGEAYASVETVMQQQSAYVRDAVTGRLLQAFSGSLPAGLAASGPATAGLGAGWAPVLWAQAFGGWGNTFSDGNGASVSSSIGGALGGFDVALGDNWRAGAFGGFSQSSFDMEAVHSSGSMDNYDVGLYAGAQYGGLGLRLGAGYAWHDVSMSRSVAFSGYHGSNSSDYMTGVAQVFGEAGYAVYGNGMALEPFAGLAYLHVDGGSGTEGGSTSALTFSVGDMDTLYSTLGVRVAARLPVAEQTLTPQVGIGWRHAFGDTTPEAVMAYASGSTPFSVAGVPVATDAAVIEAGLSYTVLPGANLSLQYNGQIASSASENAFTGRFEVKF
ncbi:autotransporter-associated beta strand repeat-containing protein [Xanthobacter agilis]|uniref:autotransporter-associated beta strand repeat-containing protein n=1 Tax=Xanthobacter agilis TaxID=47492 RepID=UPI00372C54CF